MPHAYWGGERQSERAPALGENAFWSCVLNCSRYSEAEWENEGIRRRPKADQGRSGTVEERQGCTDEQTKYPGIVANDENGALDQVTSRGKDDYSV